LDPAILQGRGPEVQQQANLLPGKAKVVISSNVVVTTLVPTQTRVSMKNPDLQYKNAQTQEFKQDFLDDWVI
jgi:hypothetical protein